MISIACEKDLKSGNVRPWTLFMLFKLLSLLYLSGHFYSHAFLWMGQINWIFCLYFGSVYTIIKCCTFILCTVTSLNCLMEFYTFPGPSAMVCQVDNHLYHLQMMISLIYPSEIDAPYCFTLSLFSLHLRIVLKLFTPWSPLLHALRNHFVTKDPIFSLS